ncbi:hypothetical protein N2152v2_006002 [Parachlorella kessleri]
MSSKDFLDLEQQDELLPPKVQQQLPSTSNGQHQRLALRWYLGLGFLSLLALWFALPGLTCLGSAAYGVAYWMLKQPKVWTAPLVPGAQLGNFTVPKILHQTWKSRVIPDKWKAAQQSCQSLHPDWEYKLWTDADGLEFIEKHYPEFLPTYLAYPYNIQRADAIRYFILYHYGGVYIDLDMGCRKPLDFMRQYNFTAPLTYPGGLSNDVMAAMPGDAYLGRVLAHLKAWNRFMVIKYIQVMFSTGPMFLTTQYSLSGNKFDVAVIPPAMYGKYDKSGDAYFYHLHGSSWHEHDAKLPAVFCIMCMKLGECTASTFLAQPAALSC